MAMYGSPVSERVLSSRELNRALPPRQLLLERSPLPLPRALEAVAGLQTQYAPAAYVGLWSRLRDFQRDDLTRALKERQAIQGTLMRSTIHIVWAAVSPPLAAEAGRARRDWWLRASRRPLTNVELDAAAAILRRHLAAGPR